MLRLSNTAELQTKDILQGSLQWLERGFYLLEKLERNINIRDRGMLKSLLVT